MDAARQLLLLGTTAWSPASISGLTSWQRADKDVYQDSGLTTPATADGDPVGGWVDQTGNGNHLVQSTGASRPVLKLTVVNGRNAVRFDGVDDYFLRNVQSSDEYTIAVALKFSGTGGLYYVVKNGTGANGHEMANNSGTFFLQNTGVAAQNDGATGTDIAIWSARRSAADGADLRKDGAARAITNGAAPIISPTTQMLVGAYTGGLFTYLGDMCEICIWNKKLTDAEIALVESYLNLRWGAF